MIAAETESASKGWRVRHPSDDQQLEQCELQRLLTKSDTDLQRKKAADQLLYRITQRVKTISRLAVLTVHSYRCMVDEVKRFENSMILMREEIDRSLLNPKITDHKIKICPTPKVHYNLKNHYK